MTALTTKTNRTFRAYLIALALPVLLFLIEYAVVILTEKSGLISIESSSFRLSILLCIVSLVCTAITFSDGEKGNFFFAAAGILISWAFGLVIFLAAFFIYFDLSFLTGRNVINAMYVSCILQLMVAALKERF